MNKQKGDKYRPIVHIEKVKNGTPTVLQISGNRYILEHKDQRSKKPMEVAEWT